MTSIFSRIFPYRQSEGRTPFEDFFTVTFADVVTKSNLFRNEFVMWLFELELENIKLIRIETHRRFNEGIPDICVKVRDTDNRNYVAIIESKIDSCVGEGQLEAYDSILSNYWPEDWLKTLIYITKYNEDVGDYEEADNIEFRQHRWSDLYERLAEAMQKKPNEVGALECELLKFMEDWEMNGGINAAHLRSFVTCFDNRVGERLVDIQNDAWHASGLNNVLETIGQWKYYLSTGEQYSPAIRPYGFRIWMGFRYDRRDDNWNVDEVEIPSPAVTLCDYHGNIEQEIPQPSKFWTDSDSVEGWPNELWIRQPTPDRMPIYGEALYDYYRDFFETAFIEIRNMFEE